MAQAIEQSTPAPLSTIGELWRQGAGAGRSRAAFLVSEADGWREVGWDEADGRVTALANGFLALDVQKGDKVAILCRTRRRVDARRLRPGDDRRGRDPDLPDLVGRRDRVHPGRLRDEDADRRGRRAAREDGRVRDRAARPRAGDRHRRRRPGRDAGRRRGGGARLRGRAPGRAEARRAPRSASTTR